MTDRMTDWYWRVNNAAFFLFGFFVAISVCDLMAEVGRLLWMQVVALLGAMACIAVRDLVIGVWLEVRDSPHGRLIQAIIDEVVRSMAEVEQGKEAKNAADQ